MITPPYLEKGDKIGILSTARKISKEDMKPALRKFGEWGLEVVEGNNLYEEHHQFAGTDEQKLEDFHAFLKDDSIKAIACARGGYGTARLINRLDFDLLKNNPKWIAGYSDITVLHSHIQQNLGMESIHGIMPVNFPKDGSDNKALVTLRKALFGEKLSYHYALPTEHSRFNREGEAEAEIVGGNYSILYSLTGTPSCADSRGRILFIEDLDEYLYHIDRVMRNLEQSGMIDGLEGMVIGGMTDMNDNMIPYGQSAPEIIHETVKKYDFPVCYDFPAGHIEDNCALIMGRKVRMKVSSSAVDLHF